MLCGCHQELSNVMFQKVLNSGDVKAGIIGRPANNVAVHPHVEFFITEAVLEHPEKTLSKLQIENCIFSLHVHFAPTTTKTLNN